MKFGKNLAHLSIPEWKPYNLDYNELKATIRILTHANNTSLKPLHNQFVENFNVINLFVTTKYGEIIRKIRHFENSFNQLITSGEPTNVKLLKLDIILSNLIDLSIVVKKLSKFILIQKIAIKKVFKKFVRHYPNKTASTQLVYKLKYYLNDTPESFINVNLLPLTIKLTNVINTVKSRIAKLRKKDEFKMDFENFNNFSVDRFALSNSAKFDLNVILKKNFRLDFLLPEDMNNLNEVLLNLNIYLNLTMIENGPNSSLLDNINNQAATTSAPKPPPSETDRVSDYTSNYIKEIEEIGLDLSHSTLNSVTFLQNPNHLGSEPSYILHESTNVYSVLISFIGGLRKYAYCFLPNHVVEDLLRYVNDVDDEGAKERLTEYFKLADISSLTRSSIEAVLKGGLKPIFKTYYRRFRFCLRKDAPVEDDEGSTAEKLQDDYLLSLNYDIFTTNNPVFVNDMSFNNIESLDKIPFYTLSMHSNDSNLLAFHESLHTHIEDDIYLYNKYPTTELNKLPTKIQRIIKNNNSINLFENYDMYQYMLSSYYNYIPSDQYINNHYSKILRLNLFKNFENAELFHKELDIEESIMKKNSSKILKSQLSLNDLQSQEEIRQQDETMQTATTPLLHQPKLIKNISVQSLSSASVSVFTNDRFRNKNEYYDEIIDHEDNESLKMFWKGSDRMEDYGVNSFINNLLDLKSKFMQGTRRLETTEVPQLSEDSFNSISNSDEEYWHAVHRYNQQHDQVLSFFYLTFISISYFISGIEIGIIYSIQKIKQENQFQLADNVWLFLVLVIGLLISVMASVSSIMLSSKRLTPTPIFHLFFVYVGIVLVVGCTAFSFIAFFD